MNPFKTQDLDRLKSLLQGKQRIVILPHTAPDGDALGSTLAWVGVLRKVLPSSAISVLSPDRVESYLSWLPRLSELVIYTDDKEQALNLLSDADLICHLDHNQTSRLRYEPLITTVQGSRADRLMIDHHLDPEQGMDLTFSYPEYSSTCELVYALTTALGWRSYIDEEIATLLSTGMVTDTGRFMYCCFSPSLYTSFADLLNLGADYRMIIDRLSYHGTLKELLLRGYVLHEKLEVLPELRTAIITLSQAEIQERGLSKGDTEGLVNLPLSVEGIDSVCFIREDRSQIKLSFRSLGQFPVNQLASRAFGGGGHLNAAGGEYQGTIAEARERYIQVLRELQQERSQVITH